MEKNQLKKFAVFTGMGVQMGATIYLGYRLGLWLDQKYASTEPLYETWITLLAVFVSITSIIVQVTKISK